MKKVIKLTESDIKRIVKRTLKEAHPSMGEFCSELMDLCEKHGMSCDCDEVINIIKPKSIEDNPFSI